MNGRWGDRIGREVVDGEGSDDSRCVVGLVLIEGKYAAVLGRGGGRGSGSGWSTALAGTSGDLVGSG